MSVLGDTLRQRREEHRWSLDDAAQRTRIRREYLEALEEGNYKALPADVQARGFLRNYALALGLPAEELLNLYRREQGDPELVSIAPLMPLPKARSFSLPGLGFFLVALVVMFVMGYLIYYGWVKPPVPPPTATVPPPTPTNILPTATPTVRVLPAPATVTATPTVTSTVYEGVEAVLQITADCWLRVTADGARIYEGTLRAGVSRTFRADRELIVLMGNAGGVRVTLNGRDLGIQGRPGQVLTQVWKAAP